MLIPLLFEKKRKKKPSGLLSELLFSLSLPTHPPCPPPPLASKLQRVEREQNRVGYNSWGPLDPYRNLVASISIICDNDSWLLFPVRNGGIPFFFMQVVHKKSNLISWAGRKTPKRPRNSEIWIIKNTTGPFCQEPSLMRFLVVSSPRKTALQEKSNDFCFTWGRCNKRQMFTKPTVSLALGLAFRRPEFSFLLWHFLVMWP